MTAAHAHGGVDPLDAAIAAEIRADLARSFPKLNQGKIAAEAFGRGQQWLSRRLTAEVPFTPAELMRLGDYLGVDIVDWMNAAKHGPAPATRAPVFQVGGLESTRRKVDAKGLAPVIPLRPRAAA